VNLAVHDQNGHPHSVTSVRLLQDGDSHTVGGGMFCTWMPYQKGQAQLSASAQTELNQANAVAQGTCEDSPS
jgi:hypothetical protein